MADRPSNPSVFPALDKSYKDSDGDTRYVSDEGMSLRDYVAAKAMQALIHNEPPALSYESRNTGDSAARVSFAAYRYADAMLAEREK